MKQFLLAVLTLLSITCAVQGQTPMDAIMMKKTEVCFALLYEHGSWDQYWEGTYLRRNGNIGTFSRNIYSPMAAIGILDRLNLIVGAAYISTKASGGQMAGVNGFQDINISLKANLYEKAIGNGNLMVLTNVGFGTPLTNYLSDYMPFSLGLGTNEVNLRGILQYKWNKGPYVRASVAHLWRGHSEVERDYYYNNGSYYTTKMDVPNAWQYQAVAGIWLLENALKLEANLTGLRCTSGDDIRKYNAGQPTNKGELDQLGASAQYYFQKPKGFGVLAYYSHIVNGRNMGKFTNLGAGITYQFQL